MSAADRPHAYDTDFDAPAGVVRPARLAADTERGRSDLGALWGALRRSWWLILGLAVAGLGLGVLAALVLPRTYFAESVILVQPQRNPLDPTAPVPPATPEVVRSQLEVIRSRRVINRVVERLNLAADPEFAESDGPDRAERVSEEVAKRLTLDNDGRSFAIKIGFEASTPAKTSRIADTFAAEYMAEQQEQKLRTSVASRAGLEERLANLRDEVFAAERAAEIFRRSNRLIILSASPDVGEDASAMSPTSRELSELARQQAQLTALRAQAEARARSASADLSRRGGRGTPEVLGSPIISSLLAQDAELARREAELAERYKPGFPAFDEVRQQRASVRAAIDREARNIEASVRSQANSARAAEAQTDGVASRLRGELDREISASVRYRQLLQEAKVRRAVYEEFAQQVGRLSQRAGVQLPDTVLVSGAPIPLKPVSPKPLLLGGGGLVAGLALGIGLALMRGWRRAAARR